MLNAILFLFIFIIGFSGYATCFLPAGFSTDPLPAQLGSSSFWEKANLTDVQIAIENGEKVNTKDSDGFTPLILASCDTSDPNIIKLLIKHQAGVNSGDKFGNTPLITASAFNSEPRVIEILIKHGANVNARSIEGKTALDYAKDNDKIYNTDVYKKMKDLINK